MTVTLLLPPSFPLLCKLVFVGNCSLILSSADRAGFQRYKAMYQFDARNADELTLIVGDEVMVRNNSFSDAQVLESGISIHIPARMQ